jgi:GH35 family endo-1,4-beta-xylanase
MTAHSVLKMINDKKLKGSTFYLGSTLADLSLLRNLDWTSVREFFVFMRRVNKINYQDRFKDTWNLAVAENNCKWFSTEPGNGVFNLTACQSLRDFAVKRGVPFRGSVNAN